MVCMCPHTLLTTLCAFCPQFPSHVPINHNLDILQDIEVENLKPAVVKIYDYYQPSKWRENREKDTVLPKEKKRKKIDLA